jgi:hypothetical protein
MPRLARYLARLLRVGVPMVSSLESSTGGIRGSSVPSGYVPGIAESAGALKKEL